MIIQPGFRCIRIGGRENEEGARVWDGADFLVEVEIGHAARAHHRFVRLASQLALHPLLRLRRRRQLRLRHQTEVEHAACAG